MPTHCLISFRRYKNYKVKLKQLSRLIAYPTRKLKQNLGYVDNILTLMLMN